MSYIEKFCLKEGICQLLHVTLSNSQFFFKVLFNTAVLSVLKNTYY